MSKDFTQKPPTIIPVVLCGGSGTRLWPLSRKSFPKQFVPLIDNQSLLTLTAKRLKLISEHLIFVGAEEHRFLIQDALECLEIQNDLILEPFPKNTAAAMAMAALFTKGNWIDCDSLLLFCPADHHIPDVETFKETILNGAEEAKRSAIVTFGVSPSYPSSAYGYIESQKLSAKKSSKVVRFIEKPSTQRAEEFLLLGNHYWNSGIFLCSVSTIIQALKDHAPDILACCEIAMKSALSEKLNSFETQDTYHFIRPNKDALMKCRSESIDYAVMEHHPNIFMVAFEGQWSDVGSWSALSDLSPRDDQGNQTIGDAIQFDSTNTYINSQKQMVVTLGVENLLVINTSDALLIAHKNKSEQVKEVVSHLVRRDDSKAILHRKVSRPWGWFDSLDQGERFQVKRISVKPGGSLSLQKHHHRAEHWIVVKGTAEVTRGNETFLLTENQSTYIPIGEVHRLINPGKTDLEMIEVQSGNYLGEDDIVRLDDTYGRTST